MGTKNGTSDILRIHDLLTDAPMLRHFLTEMGYPFGCSVGAPGLLMSLSSTNPPAGIRFLRSGIDGDLGTLLAQQGELVAIEVALEAAAGDSGAHMDGSFEKMLHELLDDALPAPDAAALQPGPRGGLPGLPGVAGDDAPPLDAGRRLTRRGSSRGRRPAAPSGRRNCLHSGA